MARNSMEAEDTHHSRAIRRSHLTIRDTTKEDTKEAILQPVGCKVATQRNSLATQVVTVHLRKL